MSFSTNPHYLAIQEFYGDQRAQRSGVLYIQHIDEGLIILDTIEASQSAKEAYCLHPIVQSDAALANAFEPHSVLRHHKIDLYAIALVMEYRSIANAYLSTRQIQSLNQIHLSPLADVQNMLIADKVQNRKDFEIYHLNSHPRSTDLQQYFKNWLEVLGISETRYQNLAKLIS